ncbi:uncharacterized protein [Choristoneura fumiferana]|uniref:uncharacterized protein n=1 Tax=Choristoneura fumiferana TaxID=7141 RepID=UPI003D15A0E4
MLDEVGKLLERVIASSINQHLADVGPNLSKGQFGFRVGRSTLDALSALKGFSAEAAERGQGAMAAEKLGDCRARAPPRLPLLGPICVRPIGIGECLRRILSKYMILATGSEVTEAAGNHNSVAASVAALKVQYTV